MVDYETQVMGAIFNGSFKKIIKTLADFFNQVHYQSDVATIQMVWGLPAHRSNTTWMKCWDDSPAYRQAWQARASWEHRDAGGHTALVEQHPMVAHRMSGERYRAHRE